MSDEEFGGADKNDCNAGDELTAEDLFARPAFHAPGRPFMSLRDRAAQFAPYKSLTGYDEMIKDTEVKENAKSVGSCDDEVDDEMGDGFWDFGASYDIIEERKE
ncbi:hypothetical protein IJ135_02420 [Candidatus Saccharibacteria bacterium]|nr:hypothetical protein [Candidatus Saccharibacteria bacterium]